MWNDVGMSAKLFISTSSLHIHIWNLSCFSLKFKHGLQLVTWINQ